MEEKNFILEFIEVYRSLPALWHIKSKEYSNRNEKNAQYSILLEKYKEKYPNAEKKDVAQKLNVLRTAYRKELKRINRLERSGAGVNDESESNLYYFDATDFLRDNEQPCGSQTSMDEENETVISEERSKRKKPDAAEELMMLAAKRLKQPPDEYEKIVASWAVKFKKMDERQRMYADKFINEILFEGQMGTLHRESMQLNTSSLPSTPQTLFTEYSSSHTPPTFTYNSNGSLTRCSTPTTNVPVPLISPQILNSEAHSSHNSTVIDANDENSLTHYFSSFQ